MLLRFDGKELLIFIPLKPGDILVNGEFLYKWANPEARSIIATVLDKLGFHGYLRIIIENKIELKPVEWGWHFRTIVTLRLDSALLEEALRKKVLEIKQG